MLAWKWEVIRALAEHLAEGKVWNCCFWKKEKLRNEENGGARDRVGCPSEGLPLGLRRARPTPLGQQRKEKKEGLHLLFYFYIIIIIISSNYNLSIIFIINYNYYYHYYSQL